MAIKEGVNEPIQYDPLISSRHTHPFGTACRSWGTGFLYIYLTQTNGADEMAELRVQSPDGEEFSSVVWSICNVLLVFVIEAVIVVYSEMSFA